MNVNINEGVDLTLVESLADEDYLLVDESRNSTGYDSDASNPWSVLSSSVHSDPSDDPDHDIDQELVLDPVLDHSDQEFQDDHLDAQKVEKDGKDDDLENTATLPLTKIDADVDAANMILSEDLRSITSSRTSSSSFVLPTLPVDSSPKRLKLKPKSKLCDADADGPAAIIGPYDDLLKTLEFDELNPSPSTVRGRVNFLWLLIISALLISGYQLLINLGRVLDAKRVAEYETVTYVQTVTETIWSGSTIASSTSTSTSTSEPEPTQTSVLIPKHAFNNDDEHEFGKNYEIISNNPKFGSNSLKSKDFSIPNPFDYFKRFLPNGIIDFSIGLSFEHSNSNSSNLSNLSILLVENLSSSTSTLEENNHDDIIAAFSLFKFNDTQVYSNDDDGSGNNISNSKNSWSFIAEIRSNLTQSFEIKIPIESNHSSSTNNSFETENENKVGEDISKYRLYLNLINDDKNSKKSSLIYYYTIIYDPNYNYNEKKEENNKSKSKSFKIFLNNIKDFDNLKYKSLEIKEIINKNFKNSKIGNFINDDFMKFKNSKIGIVINDDLQKFKNWNEKIFEKYYSNDNADEIKNSLKKFKANIIDNFDSAVNDIKDFKLNDYKDLKLKKLRKFKKSVHVFLKDKINNENLQFKKENFKNKYNKLSNDSKFLSLKISKRKEFLKQKLSKRKEFLSSNIIKISEKNKILKQKIKLNLKKNYLKIDKLNDKLSKKFQISLNNFQKNEKILLKNAGVGASKLSERISLRFKKSSSKSK